MNGEGSHLERQVVPSVEEFLVKVRHVLEQVWYRLDYAGKKHGEEVIFATGQAGAVTQCMIKSYRAKSALLRGDDQDHDNYLDLAGYAILELARRASLGVDIDGLADRANHIEDAFKKGE